MNATMSLEKTKHYPVMLNQILSIISPQHGGSFIDCTFGGGGYSEAILKFSDKAFVNVNGVKVDGEVFLRNEWTRLIGEPKSSSCFALSETIS